MSFLDERKALTREKRLSSLSHFHGNLEALIDETSGEEIKQRIRTFSQIHDDETIYAFDVLSTIEDAAIIVNGSIGCGAIGIAQNNNENFSWYSTNLVERDTILGGDDKLSEAILRAYEEKHPKAIFIVGTPVVAINNDDINSVILELEDEIGIPIISIYTDGFKTKTPVTGYDIVTHSLLKYLVSNNEDVKEDFINIISYSEDIEDVAVIADIFRELNIKFQILPRFSNVDEIKRASKARASVVLNPEEGEYLAKELEEVFGVHYIETDVPVGFRGTKNFLLKIAAFLNIEDEVIEYIDKAETELSQVVIKDVLKDKKIFVDVALSKVSAYARLFTNLGGEVVGFSSSFVDLDNRKQLKKLDFLPKTTIAIIGNGQQFEKANELAKNSIDIYFSEKSGSSFATDEGAVVISTKNKVTYGFKGVEVIANTIKKVEEFQGKYRLKSSYKESFKKRSGNWYVKQEVS
ncbi:nitrogenase molybdenum-iron protein alpha chain [Pseudobutyrivibrio sp. NOR37]|uniref:Nitrogenase molybdenum-iron protein n=1 Tax=Pseudobutyrivibrio xylanivorans TaxID=185007 RepID=A0A6M0LHQ5_PSEXY|nr:MULTISPECIES: nitrogenase component 1 [Pseudobutyrivibrio]NEX01439.1 nitrogenase molybdenum-iron protein [Pseudobutyrivibrio xylanivorans]SFR67456.1 nitrogenase molybdenum-iron protein alpha chain [Pseudobutyrivibrio sp. NOR37]